jgi:hypothetical protein
MYFIIVCDVNSDAVDGLVLAATGVMPGAIQ